MDPSQTITAATGDIVSFDNEALIIVDAQDRILGHGTKAELHQGAGTLHRAFSIFLFNDAGDVLLQQRSADKPLWPGYWSNTCCSHPRRGESYGIATRRRLMEELGVEAPLWFTHRFRYQAQFMITAPSTSCVPSTSDASPLTLHRIHKRSAIGSGSALRHSMSGSKPHRKA